MSHLDFENNCESVESKIVTSLERISQAFRVLLWQESIEHSLSPIQVQILVFLLKHSENKRKVSYLADEFNMSKSTISDAIKTLEQKELIRKEYEPQDARSYIIQLTEKGSEIADKTSTFTQEIRLPIEKLPADDKEKLLSNLLEVIRHLNVAGVITAQRMCISCSCLQSTENGQNHHCKMLNQDLQTRDLRLDCTEHENR